MLLHLVGIIGHAQSGKDTAAKWFKDRGYIQLSMADPMRRMLDRSDASLRSFIGDLEPYTEEWRARWEQYRSYQPTRYRTLLQDYGMGVREVFGDDFWIKQWKVIVESLAYRDPARASVVVPDIRFFNEASMINHIDLSMHSQLVVIERPGYGPVNQHRAEADIDTAKKYAAGTAGYVEIHNDGTVAQLHASLEKVFLPYS